MRVGLTKATKIIAVSQATALDIVKTYGYTEKIVVIPEGIDHILKFKDQKSKAKNRAGDSINTFLPKFRIFSMWGMRIRIKI